LIINKINENFAITALPLITSLINPRGYDKYIPAVFIIGLTRISQNSN